MRPASRCWTPSRRSSATTQSAAGRHRSFPFLQSLLSSFPFSSFFFPFFFFPFPFLSFFFLLSFPSLLFFSCSCAYHLYLPVDGTQAAIHTTIAINRMKALRTYRRNMLTEMKRACASKGAFPLLTHPSRLAPACATERREQVSAVAHRLSELPVARLPHVQGGFNLSNKEKLPSFHSTHEPIPPSPRASRAFPQRHLLQCAEHPERASCPTGVQTGTAQQTFFTKKHLHTR